MADVFCEIFLLHKVLTWRNNHNEGGWGAEGMVTQAINMILISSGKPSSKPDFQPVGHTNPHPCQDTRRSTSRKANVKILQELQVKMTSVQEIAGFLIPPAKLFLELLQNQGRQFCQMAAACSSRNQTKTRTLGEGSGSHKPISGTVFTQIFFFPFQSFTMPSSWQNQLYLY